MGLDFDKKHTLIVRFLPKSITEHDLKRLFQEVGTVASCAVGKSSSSQANLGFGFVEFKRKESAEKAIRMFDKTTMQDRTIRIDYAIKDRPAPKGVNTCIRNLPEDFTKEKLKQEFEKFGEVLCSRMLPEVTAGRVTKGMGFVIFANETIAKVAVDQMNGAVMEGGTIPISMEIIPHRTDDKNKPAERKGSENLRKVDDENPVERRASEHV